MVIRKGELERLKRKFLLLIMLASILPLYLIVMPTNATTIKSATEFWRQDFYATPGAAWMAFTTLDAAGNPLADIYGFGLTPGQVAAATANPDIMLTNKFVESGMFEFDINNNYTIADYPGIISPTSYAGFRRALAHLVDKTTIVDVILGGYATRLDVPLPGPQQDLFDPSGVDEYPYIYSLDRARAELDAAGFTQGSSPPLVTGGDNVRVYPPGHSKAGEDLDPIIFYPRSDSPPRWAAAGMLRADMLQVGIPVDWRPSTFAGVYGPVFTDKNYHIYTGGWGALGRFPTFLYRLYHSDWWVAGVPFPNYVTGKDAAGNPVHPELDTYLEDIFFALDMAQMMHGVQEGMEYMFNQSVTIPLWSTASYNAYRRGLLQMINEDMYGLTYNNPHLPLSIRKKYGDDTTIITALVTPPIKVNPLYTSDYYGEQVLQIGAGDPLIWFRPYNVYVDQPWTVQDWRGRGAPPTPPLTWEDNGVTKSKVIWYFRKDNAWSDGTKFTAEDFLFGTQFNYAFDDAWNWIWDINHVELADVNGDGWDEAIVYMDERSMWMFYDATGFPLPKHVYTKASFSIGPNPLHTKHTGTYPVDPATGVVDLGGVPTYVESVTGLTRFTDWNLFLAPNPTAELRILTSPLPSTVEVTWWEKGVADGYTPGNVPASEILISNGAYQITTLVPGAGGYALLESNWFRTEVVPKGEIDFYWYWGPKIGPEPRCGYYVVDMADVGIIQFAMGSAGYGPGLPPSNWVTGADIADNAASWGQIDFADYDTATASGWFLKKFGMPPYGICDGFQLQYPSYPTVSVNPQNVTLYVNNTLVIRVEVFNLTDTWVQDPNAPFYEIPQGNLWSFSLNMTWNATVLQYINHIVTIPVEIYPLGILHQPSIIVTETLDPTNGLYNLQASSQSPATPFNNPNASSIVFEMAFKAIATTNETTQIAIPHVILIDPSGRHIGFDSEGNPLYLGVRNGSVKVKLPGDIDGDRDVDYDDFIVLAGSYGTSSGEPAFDERADFDRDGDIDYDDFIQLAGNFGKTY